MRIGWFLIWTNLNPLHPRKLWAKIGWNWPSGFGEEEFLISSMNFSLLRNYLPLEKGRAGHLNKLEYPSLKDALGQVWLKLAQWFWRRRFFYVVNVFFAFSKLFPLCKGQGPSFEQNWIPITQLCFVSSLVEIGPVVLEKKMKMWKVHNQQDRQTMDNRWSEKLTWAFSSGELKTIVPFQW